MSFFDDILIYSRTLDEHVEHLSLVLTTLREHRLFANEKRCLFGQPQLEYLGHIISGEGVAMDVSKIAVMLKWLTPSMLKEL